MCNAKLNNTYIKGFCMKELPPVHQELSQNTHEVIKNRVFGMPTTPMTRHQRVSFTAMIKIAYDQLAEDKDKNTFTYPTKEFFKMIGLSEGRKQSHIYANKDDWGKGGDEYSLERNLEKLLNKTINLKYKDPITKEYVVEGVVLVSYFKLTKDIITFRFDKWIRDKIPSVNNMYIMKMPIIASFKSGHTVNLFEQIEQRRDFKKWNVPILDLKLILGITEGAYNIFSNFRRTVIERSIKEINEKTSYTLAYKLTKKGRNIDKIIFTWHITKEEDPYAQWKTFLRKTFTDVPLLQGMVGRSEEVHLIQINDKGLLYNKYNPSYVYISEEAKRIWKHLYENQDKLLIKNKNKANQDEKTTEEEMKDYSSFIGKDYLFDGDLYQNIILITALKSKLKVKFYDGDNFILTEAELNEGIIFGGGD